MPALDNVLEQYKRELDTTMSTGEKVLVVHSNLASASRDFQEFGM